MVVCVCVFDVNEWCLYVDEGWTENGLDLTLFMSSPVEESVKQTPTETSHIYNVHTDRLPHSDTHLTMDTSIEKEGGKGRQGHQTVEDIRTYARLEKKERNKKKKNKQTNNA